MVHDSDSCGLYLSFATDQKLLMFDYLNCQINDLFRPKEIKLVGSHLLGLEFVAVFSVLFPVLILKCYGASKCGRIPSEPSTSNADGSQDNNSVKFP